MSEPPRLPRVGHCCDEARLSELDEELRERERAELLAEIDSEGPLAGDLRDRVATFAAADLEGAERMPEWAYTLATRGFLADLLLCR
jgi:hypothetical protein